MRLKIKNKHLQMDEDVLEYIVTERIVQAY